MFHFELTDQFKKILERLAKRNPLIARAVNRKIKEIISKDKEEIKTYKNLKYEFKDLKRVHITNWLVMTFKVDMKNEYIIFDTIKTRDKVYKKK